ncbi:hypothetical protein Tco_0604017 [Tanacetum coccineum]
MAERLQAQEYKELFDAEKATLFQQLLEKRRKHFAAKRAEEQRNNPPTQAQQRKIICTYLKNMEGYKLKNLKLKEFNYIQEMFDRAFKRVNTFEDFRTELVEGKEKKQKVEDDKEIAELKQIMEIIPDEEEVIIDAIPLAIYMLVEKKYPLPPSTLSMMLEKKLIIDNESEMAYQLLKFIMKQLKNLLDDAVRITAAHVCVNTAQLELVLLRDFKENMLNCSAEVNAASENMLEVTTASEYQVNAAS